MRQFKGFLNIMILSPLIPSSKQDNNGVSVFREIDSISGTIINPQFRYALADRLNIPWIAQRQTTDMHVNTDLCQPVAQTVKPLGIYVGLAYLDHGLLYPKRYKKANTILFSANTVNNEQESIFTRSRS